MFKTFFGQTRNQQIFLKISSFLVITSLVFLNQLVSPLVAEAAVLFSNGFENNFNSWDIASGQWGINASSPHSGSRKARVNGSTGVLNDTLQKFQSTAGHNNITLGFWYRINQDLESNDHVFVEWSANGIVWNNLANYTNLNNGNWIQASFNLPAGAANQSNFRFRFRADLNSGNDEFALDDVQLSGDVIVVPPSGSISGLVFDDLNGNGVRDDGEAGLVGRTVSLSGAGTATTLTTAGGNYSFNNLANGNYQLCQTVPANWTQTLPVGSGSCSGSAGLNVSLSSGNNTATARNFGTVLYGSITIINQTDPAGTLDSSTATLDNINPQILNGGSSYVYRNVLAGTHNLGLTVPAHWYRNGASCTNENNPATITLSAGQNISCTFTTTKYGSITVNKISNSAEGTYNFNFSLTGQTLAEPLNQTITNSGNANFIDLVPGNYSLSEINPEGWTGTTTISGCDNNNLVLVAGQNIACLFNNTQYGSIAGRKAVDLNGDSNIAADPGLANWTITLTQKPVVVLPLNNENIEIPEVIVDDQPPAQSVQSLQVVAEVAETPVVVVNTDQSGNYLFSNLTPATYLVCEQAGEGWYQSFPSSGYNCDNGTKGYEIVISAGQNSSNNDFGNYQKGSIKGYVYHDLDMDGLKDQDESGLNGWTVELVAVARDTETVVATTVSGEDGLYVFSDLTPGSYIVREVQKTAWLPTAPVNPQYLSVTLSSGQEAIDNNFGNKQAVDLVLTKTQDRDTASIARSIIYTLTVSNNSPHKATAVTVSDPQPAGLYFQSYYPSQGSYANSTWTVGDLDPGVSATLSIYAVVAPDAGTSVTNSATAASQTTDYNPKNNSAEVRATIVAGGSTGSSGGNAGGVPNGNGNPGTNPSSPPTPNPTPAPSDSGNNGNNSNNSSGQVLGDSTTVPSGPVADNGSNSGTGSSSSVSNSSNSSGDSNSGTTTGGGDNSSRGQVLGATEQGTGQSGQVLAAEDSQISQSPANSSVANNNQSSGNSQPTDSSGYFPWFWIILAMLLFILIFWWRRRKQENNQ